MGLNLYRGFVVLPGAVLPAREARSSPKSVHFASTVQKTVQETVQKYLSVGQTASHKINGLEPKLSNCPSHFTHTNRFG